jgi:hypothetical protein
MLDTANLSNPIQFVCNLSDWIVSTRRAMHPLES